MTTHTENAENMGPVLLSICVPTFNRIAYLRELLPQLIREMESVHSDSRRLELVISDNSSDDGTQQYCQNLKCPFLVYSRNDVNVGGDRNFLVCINRARGEYIWLFGDDDLLLEQGVARVVELLRQSRPALVILTEEESTQPTAYGSYAACLADRMGRQRLFSTSHTLITANVFHRDFFDLNYAAARLHTNYAHMYGLMHRLAQGGPVWTLPGVFRMRPVRAQFERWPFALCVKQAIYLLHIARWFNAPTLRYRALRLFANLPLELASCFLRIFSKRFGRT